MILNAINGLYYIGSAKDITKRKNEHINHLSNGTHANSHLQHAWNAYGCEAFDFIVLEETSIENLTIIEQIWLDCTDCCTRGLGYNLKSSAIGFSLGHKSNLGRKHTEETKAKMRLVRKGKKLPESHRLAIKNRKYSPEHRAKLSAWQIGKVVSDETKAKISAANKGKIRSAEYSENMSKAKKGIKFTEEHKQKIKNGLKASYARKREMENIK